MLLAAAPASAAIVVKRDAEGRPITFDVRARGAHVDWYARQLRRAIHGAEISSVTFWIVPRTRVPAVCGKGAVGCYQRSRAGTRIVLPKGRSPFIAATLFHEYAHHVDLALRVDGIREPNGSARWFAARRMRARLAAGKAAIGYARGWNRSVGEIFAED